MWKSTIMKDLKSGLQIGFSLAQGEEGESEEKDAEMR